MRIILLLAAALVLSGCLTTPRPVFNEANSIPAGESPNFVRFVEAWEAEVGKADSPREMIENGDRIVDLDGLIIVEDRSSGYGQYMAVGLMGKRLMICLVHHQKIEEIAARHAVKVTVDRDAVSDPSFPTQIQSDGTDHALYAFVIDAFTDGLLVCQSPTDTVRSIN